MRPQEQVVAGQPVYSLRSPWAPEPKGELPRQSPAVLDVDLFPSAVNPSGALLQPGLHEGDLVCPSGLRSSVEHAVEIRSGQDLIIRVFNAK